MIPNLGYSLLQVLSVCYAPQCHLGYVPYDSVKINQTKQAGVLDKSKAQKNALWDAKNATKFLTRLIPSVPAWLVEQKNNTHAIT